MTVMVEQNFANALPDGIVCLDQQFSCLWWNDAACELLHLDTSHLHRSFFDVVEHHEVKKLFDHPQSSVLEFKSPFSTSRWLTLMLSPYHEGQTLAIVRDITHTHALDTIRKDFIANVSHELRTPLTVFRGYLELLEDRNDVSPMLKDILSQMSGQSDRMLSLVQDLLLLSRLESVEPDASKRTMVNVAGMLRNIGDEARSLSGKKAHKIHLQLDESIELFGQPEELYSAFSNIIFNAVHYTPECGDIDIKWYQDDDAFVLLVQDSGVGIAKEDIPKLTQRFYRTDKARSRAQDREGTGLGLAIVKHVMLRHAGELIIESTLGKGSQFYCRLPKGV